MLRSLLLGAALAKLGTATYTLTDSYTASNFFSKFSFWTTGDPTNGYVDYVDQGTAQSNGLINTNNGQVYLGVDYNNVASGSGRQSVRLTSTASYNHGLVILDLAHMPGSICGVWPAFWMVGPNWPAGGEIDIIEGVNTQIYNAMTLHTSDGCTVSNTNAFTGTMTTSNCYIDAAGQSNNAGCDIQDSDSRSYGNGFNENGGGVFATQWTSNVINIWYFNGQGHVPSDIQSGNPNPANWPEPDASFSGNCDIDSHFQNLQIVFDTTFCGDWAGNVWGSNPSCTALSSSCTNYVQNNPGAFAPAYWLINSLKVYQSSSNEPVQGILRNSTSPPKPASEAPIKTSPLAMGGGLHNSSSSRIKRDVAMAF